MYKLELTQEELILVIKALEEIPAKFSRDLLNKIEHTTIPLNNKEDEKK